MPEAVAAQLVAPVDSGVLALLVLVGLLAGWVDAVVGGGGLVQIPALLLGLPGATPAQVLATNKVSSIFGTATSSVTYARRVGLDRGTLIWMVPMAVLGSALGAASANVLPENLFRPLILVLLIVVAVYTLARPQLGLEHVIKHTGRAHALRAALIGLGLGFYDGIFGPGTGSFLVIAMVSVLGFSFLAASANAKVTNFATNLGAVIVFTALGAPVWNVGIPMGIANIIGGYLGARTATRYGSGFVRIVFLVVVSLLILRLGYDVVR